MESVLLTTPYLMLCAITVVVIIIFEKIHKATGFFLPFVAMALSSFVIINAVIEGAKVLEVLIFAILVLILFTVTFLDKEEEEDK